MNKSIPKVLLFGLLALLSEFIKFEILFINLYDINPCACFFLSRCMLLDHGYLSCFAVSGPLHLINRCISETTLPFFVSSINIDLPADVHTSTGFHESVGLLCLEAKSVQRSTGVAQLPNISRPILGPVRILRGPTRQQVDFYIFIKYVY